MAFIFENRKGPGKSLGDQPQKPAVRITRHNEGEKSRNRIRLYFAFTPEGVKIARWILGDKIVVGCDPQNNMLCFKRDQTNGYTISGGAFQKGKGNASFQISTSEDSSLWKMLVHKLGEWFDLTDDGPMMIASVE